MSLEEKPPEHPDAESLQSSADISNNAAENSANEDQRGPVEATVVDQLQSPESHLDEPILAQTVEDDTNFATEINPVGIALSNPPPMASNLENMAAKGGAIGALVLGIWCIIGSFITNWTIINGVVGVLMGIWGLTSRKRKTAFIGIVLCLVGIFMCLVQVSEMVNNYLNAVDETPY